MKKLIIIAILAIIGLGGCNKKQENATEAQCSKLDTASKIKTIDGKIAYEKYISIGCIQLALEKEKEKEKERLSKQITIFACEGLGSFINTTSDESERSKAMKEYYDNDCDRRMGEWEKRRKKRRNQ